MEPSNSNSSAAMAGSPAQSYPYPYHSYLPTGRSPDGRQVQPSTSAAHSAPSFGEVHSRTILDSPLQSSGKRGRESDGEGDDASSDRKISRQPGARLGLPALSLPASQPTSTLAREPGSHQGDALGSARRPEFFLRNPAGVRFSIFPAELAALRAASDRPIRETGSSSTGELLAEFTAPPQVQAPPQGLSAQPEHVAPVSARRRVRYESGKFQGRRSRTPQRPDPATRPLPSFDPVTSQVAKVFRGTLRKALAEGTSDSDLHKQLIMPMAGSRTHLSRENLAFTPEFLVAVLLALPTLDEAQRTTLGNAVGRLRMVGSGKLSASTRFAIAEAFEHAAVRSRVSLDALLTFLAGTEKTESKRWSASGDDRPLRYFTNSGWRCGIPQALAKLLVDELENADQQDLAPLLATTRRLGLALAPEISYRRDTESAFVDAIDASSAPTTAKQQVKEAFLLAYRPLGKPDEEVELSE